MKVLFPFSTSVNLTEVDDLQICSKILFSLGKILNGCSVVQIYSWRIIAVSTKCRFSCFFAVWVFPKLPSIPCNAVVVIVVKSTDPESSFGRQTCVFLQNLEHPLGTVIPSVHVSVVKVLVGGWSGGSPLFWQFFSLLSKSILATSGKFPASSFFKIFFFFYPWIVIFSLYLGTQVVPKAIFNECAVDF